MEKKTFLAIALSMMVLLVYYNVVGSRKKINEGQQLGSNVMQTIDSKEVTEHIEQVRQETPETVLPLPPVVETKETINTIETDTLIAEFSNIGGSLKNVIIKEYDYALPVTDIFGLNAYSDQVFSVNDDDPTAISYLFDDGNVAVTKSYSHDNEYIINASITIVNKLSEPKTQEIAISGFNIAHDDLKKQSGNPRDKTLMEYAISDESGIFRKSGAFKFSAKNFIKKGAAVDWAGFRDKYFCIVAKPDFVTTGYSAEPIGSDTLQVIFEADKVVLSENESKTYNGIIYVGPQDSDILQKYELGFENIIRYSGIGLLNAISVGIVKILKLLHKIIPSWGVCIILIGALVYLVLSPLTLKGMGSMKKMQALQPEMTKLREQHKNNPQRLNKEMMELYKEHKINPLGGCFPLLLQMPVFIGLYQALWRSVMFKGQSFLWIKDLSQPDRLFIFPTTLPIIGNELNILPLLMMVIMYFQQKATTKNMASADPAQAQQQKMMTTMFPLLLGFIFYKFASGLALYFTVFYTLSLITQLKMAKS